MFEAIAAAIGIGVSYYSADQNRKAANRAAKIAALGQATAAAQYSALFRDAAIVALVGAGVLGAFKLLTAKVD